MIVPCQALSVFRCNGGWISGKKYEAWTIGANTERNTEWPTAQSEHEGPHAVVNPGRVATRRARVLVPSASRPHDVESGFRGFLGLLLVVEIQHASE